MIRGLRRIQAKKVAFPSTSRPGVKNSSFPSVHAAEGEVLGEILGDLLPDTQGGGGRKGGIGDHRLIRTSITRSERSRKAGESAYGCLQEMRRSGDFKREFRGRQAEGVAHTVGTYRGR